MIKTTFFTLISVAILPFFIYANGDEGEWPKRVLITNDDGIRDGRISKLAQAFSRVAETWVVAPLENSSGSSHYISVYRKHVLNVEEISVGDGIKAYGVDGYPGDCVLLALKGLMKDNPPDLVISGINDGANLGFDWIASGTVGAARIAAYWGVPAIAVSGMKEEIPRAMDAACKWILKLARSDLVRRLKNGQYLVVNIPRIPPSEIKGIKTAEPAGILLDFSFAPAREEKGKALWQMLAPKRIEDVSPRSDAALYHAGYIVIVPMLADETDHALLSVLSARSGIIPEWNE